MQVPSLGRVYPWRRKWQPAPVFLNGKLREQRSLVGYTVHWVAKSQARLRTHTHTDFYLTRFSQEDFLN